jgi:hypothetical protein
MKKSTVLFIAAMLALPAVAAAQDTSTTTPVAPTPPARPMVPASSPTGPNSAENQTMVCRTGLLIGSRIPGPQVCKTQWQWDEARRIARKTIEHMQVMGYNGPAP